MFKGVYNNNNNSTKDRKMEVIKSSSDVNVIYDNYISNVFQPYLLHGFTISISILTIIHIFSIMMYIRDKLNKINETNENELSRFRAIILRLDKQDENNKKRIEIEEKNIDDLVVYVETLHKNNEKYKQENDKNISTIQIVIVEVTKRITEMQDKMNDLTKEIDSQNSKYKMLDEKNRKYEEFNENVCQQVQGNVESLQNNVNKQINKITRDIEKQVSTIDTVTIITNKQITSLREEIQNVSSGYNFIPINAGLQGYCDINSEKMIFNCIMDFENISMINLSLNDVDNVLIYNIANCNKYIKHNGLTGPFKLLEQFKKIKSLYFEFNGVTNKDSIPSGNNDVLNKLFHKITEITPTIEIYYRCKDINPHAQNTPEIIKEFTKTNKYSSFHLEVENNFTKDPQTGNMRHISSTDCSKLKEHCRLNNIKFVSNIGI